MRRRSSGLLRVLLLVILFVPQLPARAPDGTSPTFVVSGVQPDQPLRLVVYGDMRFTDTKNTTDTSPQVRKWLAARVAEEHPDALLVTGDIPFHGSDPHDWAIFHEEAASWRQHHLRVYPTVGNHEVIPDFRAGYANYFAAFPELEGHHVYSVLLGNVYVISLNSSEPVWPGGYQADWLRQQMDHLPEQADFVFVMIHVPLIADIQSEFLANIPSPESVALRQYLEQCAARMRQKMIVVSGHIHNYERFEEKGITHLISGGGGARPYPVYFPGSADLYRARTYPNFHYLVLRIDGPHLEGTMYRVANPKGPDFHTEVRDTFQLDAKPRGPMP